MSRIVFLHLTPFPAYSGGIDNWLYNMIGQLEQRGLDTVVIAPGSDAAPFYDVSAFSRLEIVPTAATAPYQPVYRLLTKLWRPLGALPVALTYARWVVSAATALHRIRRSDDSVIALHILPTMLPVWLLRVIGGSGPTVCYLRGRIGADLDDAGHPRLAQLYQAIERRAVRRASIVLANGSDTAKYAADVLGVAAQAIPNGVSFARFARPESGEANAALVELRTRRARGATVIMTVGTLRDVKGVRLVIQAAGHLARTSPQLRAVFAFVGKGDPAAYQELAQREGVGDRVIFCGEQTDIPAFLADADVTLAVSGGGGTSNAAIEQMAAGKPIVAWDNLTYSQLLVHGVTGHLVHERDPEALANGIVTLLGDPEYAARLGASARLAAERYDWPAIADEFLGALG